MSQQLQAVDAYDDLRKPKQGQQKYALTHVRCCLLSTKTKFNHASPVHTTLYGERFSVNHDVVRIWVMLKIKGKYKQHTQKNTNC